MRSLVAAGCGVLLPLLLIAGCSGGHAGMNMGDSQPAAIAATGAAASPIAGATTVNATLNEYAVTIDTARVPRGPVHLVVTNQGQRPHELRIYPRSASSSSKHDMTSGLIPGTVGLLQLIPVGATAVLDVTLPAGSWEVACHLQDFANGVQFDHYDKGMKTTFGTS